ncbi:MAG: hemerythrin family protein [Betaproteobacteria bacterium]|nr:hemerythrin family protein [Betaproteobacteria bacterium]MBI2960532.1 hemerythrin family protein [Betaproteobacteria bacterium]
MKWINWGEKQKTGNADMDHGHEKLVELINQLADGMESKKSKEFCSNVLEQFVEETRKHFTIEERLMDLHRYPKAKEHTAMHERFLKDVLTFKASYDAGATAEFTTLLVILDSWVNRDIMVADKGLAEFLATAG